MKITKKLISLLLAVLMLCGTLTCFSITASAADEATTETGTGVAEEADRIDYLTTVFATPEEKIATMKLMLQKGQYQIYADEDSGEVAIKDTVSGQILFTNPYDIAATNAVDSVKNTLMSQIIVRYTENGRPKEYFSYEHAAIRDQIKVKNIKNGIRVEYTIGREEARRLVPRMIEKSRFEELIRQPVLEYYGGDENNFYFTKFMAYFSFKSLEKCESDRLKADLLDIYPVVEKMDIYVFDSSATMVEIEEREQVIKTACPNYSYEEMDYDHQLTEYEGTEENPPVFKMALEYTIEEDGFSVRLPANGIRFNESKFQLESVCVLPYMGAGNSAYEGYTFFPDGSGALFAFEDLVDVTSNSVASKVYGTDYAYHEITGTYQQTVRYPVFGVVEKTRYYDFEKFDEKLGESTVTRINGMIYDKITDAQNSGKPAGAQLSKYTNLLADGNEPAEEVISRGYVAIIEEGDAMAEIAAIHEGVKHPYDSMQMSFYPRPQDTYNMAEAISVGTATDWTVVSTRKYVGNYKIRYVMLTDEKVAAEKKLATGEWYDATWMGMAMAYRDYLIEQNVLTPLTEEQTSGDIPLYIEAFGSVETVEKYLSIPFNVKKPLTSFQDVQTMYAELMAEGVNNINFKLTGHANGGMYAKAAYNLKWEKSVSKDVSFQELLDFAAKLNDGDYADLLAYVKDKELFETEEELAAFEAALAELEDANLGIYPDFDFSYIWSFEDTIFDGLNRRKHVSRTIDDRSAQKRVYVATRQKYMSYYQLAVSPAYFSHFYEKLASKYLDYDNVQGISVGSLGNTLNSDFDEDEPYNREDSKTFVKKALDFFSSKDKSNIDVMVDGGNAYTWQYVNHILGAAIDSSRYIRASYSVPFLGVVLHGYTNFTGTPLNMEGDLNYAKLKAIENGAAVYFTLSYQNTQTLKEDELLSQYYSIRYDIWFDDVVEIYNELNREMKDLQDKPIVGHQFLSGMRVPDTDELYNDIMADYNAVLDFQSNKAEYEAKLKNEAVADARDKIANTETSAVEFIKLCLKQHSDIEGAAYKYVTGERSFERRYSAFVEADEALKAVQAAYDAASEEEKAALAPALESAKSTRKNAKGQLSVYIRDISKAIRKMEVAYENLNQLLIDAESGALLISGTENIPESILEEIELQLAATEKAMAQVLGTTFDLTLDKAELDTFIHTHVAYLILASYGDLDATVVDKMEKLFNMIESGEYGLMMNEVEMLRYLEANRGLSDDAIIEKYSLSEDASSIKGLVLYMEELLGDAYTFDPTVTADDTIVDGLNAKERNLLAYYRYVLYSRILGLSDSAVIPSLNFVPTRLNDKGKNVSNTANIKKVTDKIDALIKDAFKGKDGVFTKIENGDYTLESYFTAKDMEALVAACAAEISKATPKSDNPVEYATPDTMLTDLENYIRSKYYQAALEEMIPSNDAVSLHVVKVNSKTDDSVKLLIAKMVEKYGKGDGTNYAATMGQFLSDEFVAKALSAIADAAGENYGIVYGDIVSAYIKQVCVEIIGKKAAALTLDGKNDAKKAVMEAVDTALEAAMADVNKSTEDAIADVTAALNEAMAANEVTFKADIDAALEVSDYVYYAYIKRVTEVKTDNFYYDAQLGGADMAIRGHVDALYTALIADMDANATVYDVYNVVLAAMISDEYGVKKFTADLANGISYSATEKNNLATDLLNHYVYTLLNRFEEKLPEDAPAISALRVMAKSGDALNELSSSQLSNATKLISSDVKDKIAEIIADIQKNTPRGALPNYALFSAITAEELKAFVEGEIATLTNSSYHADINSDKVKEELKAELQVKTEELAEELTAYFQYQYYTTVLGLLNADKAPAINVSEVYGDDLYTAGQGFKSLLRYYVTQFSAVMTDEEIDAMLGGSSTSVEEEEESESKYVSNDGRIVAVTYGVPNAEGTFDEYKTFILNYNNFSVSVVYEDITYTIPAYSYVSIVYDQEGK